MNIIFKNRNKKILIAIMIVFLLLVDNTLVSADTTPQGTVGGTAVIGYSYCSSNIAGAMTASLNYDSEIMVGVEVAFRAINPNTGEYYIEYKNSYGISSTSVTFVVPNGYNCYDISAHHFAEKYGQQWEDHTYETFP